MEKRLNLCDTVFYLDYPLEVCLQGIEQRKGKPRSDMPWIETGEPDPEFIAFVHNFPKVNRYEIIKLLNNILIWKFMYLRIENKPMRIYTH